MRNLKKILALVLALMMTVSLMVVASAASIEDYEDADSVSDQYVEAVDVLTGMGLFKGDENGFRPQDPINRAEVSTIIYRMMSKDTDDSDVGAYAGYADESFTDLDTLGWNADGYIGYSTNLKYVIGNGDGTFNPTGNITGYELLTILMRLVGYDENDEFAENWPINVMKVVDELGLLAAGYIDNLNAPLTREEVAYLIFATLTQVQKVYYTPAFGYRPYPTANMGTTIGKDNFKLTQNNTAHDDWGRPFYTWTYNTGSKTTTINYPVTADFETAATECDVVVALDENDDVTVNTITLNGKEYTSAATNLLNGNRKFDATETKKTVGAQGRLTEIYSYVDTKGAAKVDVVMIDQFLAKVVDVKDATFDAADHLKTPATIVLDIYQVNTAPSAAGSAKQVTLTNGSVNYEYTKGDMVLVYAETDYNDNVENGTAQQVEILGEADAVIATQTAYRNGEYSKFGDDTYYWAAQYHLGNRGNNNTNYVVYTDTYGNLIGLAVPTATYGYGVITAIAWQDSDHLEDEYIEANIMGVDGTPLNNVTITNNWTNNGNGNGDFSSVTNAKVSEDKNKNGAFYNHLVKYSVDANGGYEIEAMGPYHNAAATLNPNVSYVAQSNNLKPAVNDNTVYLVKTTGADGKPVYTSYTGYKNVSAMSGAEICWFPTTTDAYIEYIYVDATKAVYAGSTELATVFDDGLDMESGNLKGYDMWVNGEEVTRFVGGGKTLADALNAGKQTESAIASTGTYLVTYDANGFILSMDLLSWAGDSTLGLNTTKLDAYYCDGTVIRNSTSAAEGAVSYGIANANIYVIHSASQTVTEGDYADVADATAGVLNYMVLSADSKNVVTTYVVVND